jgi:ribosomal protein S18 acetylase RimI-like enzyme
VSSGAAPPRGSIRPAAARDLDAVVALWIELTRHHEALDPLFRLRESAEGELRELLRAVLQDPDAHVLLHEPGDGPPDGLCIVRVDRAPPIYLETERAEITDLGVRAAVRRRGIGRALAEAALRWVRARGVARVEVRVVAANAAGRAFWRGLGFGPFVDVLQRRL